MTPRPAHGEPVAWLESLDMLGMKFGLTRMRALLARLGHPERIAAIHVVGTNGKSSTTRMAARALSASGRLTGAYTSPHVTGWRERIEIDGRPVSEEDLAAALAHVRAAADALGSPPDDGVTQFEVLTAAALVAFRDAGVTAAVVEAGLGGRYDATNVLPDDAVVALTNVSLEHTDLLGDTEAEIAAEKLAVATPGSDRVVLGRLSPAADVAVTAIVAERGLAAWRQGRDHDARACEDGVVVRTPFGEHDPVRLRLRGGFQRDNLSLAVASVERLLGERLAPAAVAAAAAAIVPGRMELVPGAPAVLLDGAHNPAGIAALAAALPDALAQRPRVAVVSVLGDKDLAAMTAALAGAVDLVVATASAHRRAVSPEAVRAAARDAGVESVVAASPQAAIGTARAAAGPEGAVIVCGSLYLLAELRPRLVGLVDETPDTLARARDTAGVTDQAQP